MLAEHQNEALSDEELDNVAGGSCSGFTRQVVHTMGDVKDAVSGVGKPYGTLKPDYSIHIVQDNPFNFNKK